MPTNDPTDIWDHRVFRFVKIKFIFALPMYTSGRRFEKEGLIATACKYVMSHFWVLLFQKPFHNEYTYVGDEESLNE